MKLYRSESGARPEPLDVESSPTTVYVNENVQEIRREEETLYAYDVREFERGEWEDLQTAQYILELEMELAG